MSKYLYMSCLGNFFESDHILSYDEEHCNQCGDTQEYIGEFETEEERKKLEDDYKPW